MFVLRRLLAEKTAKSRQRFGVLFDRNHLFKACLPASAFQQTATALMSSSQANDSLKGVFARDIKAATLDRRLLRAFLDATTDRCYDYLCKEMDRGEKVVDFQQPEQLRQVLGSLLDVSGQGARDVAQLLGDVDLVLAHCVRTGHPRFFNQVTNGVDVVSTVGEWLTATVNTNMFTYEISPVFLLLEQAVLRAFHGLCGYNPDTSCGILAPGGSISNLYGVLAARYRARPEARSKGLFASCHQLVIFTSAHSHYSVTRAGIITGIGSENVVQVAVDERGKMVVADLEAKVAQAKQVGKKPFCVFATAGSTVLGAFDPIRDIAAVATANDMWLHVDASWGGGALLSEKHRHLLDGVELSNSLTWNPHKMMGVTLQCSVFLTRDKLVLHDMNAMSAGYLFQQDKNYDVAYDTGDKTIQCGRHNDILKLWLLWRSLGRQQLAQRVDHFFDVAKFAVEELQRRNPHFVVLLPEPECPNVCFWYLPSCLLERLSDVRHQHHPHRHLHGGVDPVLLHRVASYIKKHLMERGDAMVGYQPLGDRPNFFRIIISNSSVTRDDVVYLLDEIDAIGSKISLHDLQAWQKDSRF